MCRFVRLFYVLRFLLFALFFFFFFNDPPPPEIYTLSLHDALPIADGDGLPLAYLEHLAARLRKAGLVEDRKSTRLNSSHRCISYAVFCLKKKKKKKVQRSITKEAQIHDRVKDRPRLLLAYDTSTS